MRPAKTQISLRIRAVWSESSLSAWKKKKKKKNYKKKKKKNNLASLAIENAPSEDSDQTARMRRLIWIFVGRTCRRYVFWRNYAYGSYDLTVRI